MPRRRSGGRSGLGNGVGSPGLTSAASSGLQLLRQHRSDLRDVASIVCGRSWTTVLAPQTDKRSVQGPAQANNALEFRCVPGARHCMPSSHHTSGSEACPQSFSSSHSCTAEEVPPSCTPDVEALPAAMGAGAVDADAAVADGVQRAAAIQQHIAGVHPRVQLTEAPGRRVGLPDGRLPVHPHRLPTKGKPNFHVF